jgi:hypothetical protein
MNPLTIEESLAEVRGHDTNAALVFESFLIPRM